MATIHGAYVIPTRDGKNKRTSKLYHCFYSGKNGDLKVWIRSDVLDIVARRSFPGKVKQEH